jgi:hypothetical protein
VGCHTGRSYESLSVAGEDFLGVAHVDSLAFRTTGADFPSLCIESMIDV